jgi:antitoxin YefM
MDAISYTAARANLAGTMSRVCDDHEPVVITRRGEPSVVMLSLEDFKALEEVVYKPADEGLGCLGHFT